MVSVNGQTPQIIPNSFSQEATRDLAPEKKQEIQTEVCRLIADGKLNGSDLTQLRNFVATRLFGADAKPENLSPAQYLKMDALIVDALDGNIDGSNNTAEIARVATVEVQQVERASFSPVAFSVPESQPEQPAADGPVKITFNLPQTQSTEEENIPVTGPSTTGSQTQPSTAGSTTSSNTQPSVATQPSTTGSATQPTTTGSVTQPTTTSPSSVSPATVTQTRERIERLASGSSAELNAFKQELKNNPELMRSLLEGITPANLSSKASMAILALALEQPGDQYNNLIYDKLSGLKDTTQAIAFYTQMNNTVKAMGMPNAARKANSADDWGVMRKLAEIHFSSSVTGTDGKERPEILNDQTRFDILMKLPNNDSGIELLGPLIRSMDNDPANKAAIQTEAQRRISDYQAAVARGEIRTTVITNPGTGPVVTTPVSTTGGATGPAPEPPEVARARKILEILNGPGDATAPTRPTTTASTTTTPTTTTPSRPVTVPSTTPSRPTTPTTTASETVPTVTTPTVTTPSVTAPPPWTEDAEARERLEQLSKEQQELFKTLYARFSDLQPQLRELLKNGTLQKTDSRGQTILSNLDRLLKGPVQSGVNAERLAADAIRRLADRSLITQGPHGTDGAASLEFVLAKDDPAELIRTTVDLAISARSTLRDGTTLNAGTSSFSFHKGSAVSGGQAETRDDFDIIFQSAVMRSVAQVGGDAGNPWIDADYNVNKDNRSMTAAATGDTGSDPELLRKVGQSITGKPYVHTESGFFSSSDAYAQIEADLRAGRQPMAVVDREGGSYSQYVAIEKIENGRVYFRDTYNSGTPGRNQTDSLEIDQFKSRLKHVVGRGQ